MKQEILTARLHHGREQPVQHGHPWLFSGAIAAWHGDPQNGPVDVVDNTGAWLGRGLTVPDAALAIRIYTRNPEETMTAGFFVKRLEQALAWRQMLALTDADTNACRLVYSEADGLSGLIVDQYADQLSVKLSARALLPYLGALLEHLRQRTGLSNIHVSVEDDAAERENLKPDDVAVFNTAAHSAAEIRQDSLCFKVDVAGGQKTGFFLDQRQNRRQVAGYAQGRRVLSAYCYTGGFEVYAAAGGAQTLTGIDRSEEALARARENLALNKTEIPLDYLRADVPEQLRRYRDMGQNFDLIILDPPRFVFSRAGMDKGLRAYKDINLLALKLLTPGGILATFSCSGLVHMEDFKRMLDWSAHDSGRRVRILETLGQPADHPVLCGFPESEYLKGLICAVD